MRNVQNIGGAIHSLNDAQLGNVWTLMQARNVRNVRVEIKGGVAEGGTRTPTSYLTRPSNVRVCQFRHFGLGTVNSEQ